MDITEEKIAKALNVLHDNGIELEECGTVLQAIGYVLLDVELDPLIEKVEETDWANCEE